MTNVTIYTKENCMPCKMMKKQLEERGVVPNVVDVEKDPEGIAKVRALGYETVPVIQSVHLVFNGFRPDKIPKLLGQAG